MLLKPGDRAASGNATTQLFTFGRHLDSPLQGTGSMVFRRLTSRLRPLGDTGFEPVTLGVWSRYSAAELIAYKRHDGTSLTVKGLSCKTEW